MKNEFQVSWIEWKSLYSSSRSKYGEDVWGNISSHPLDKILDEFGQLLLDATPSQKNILDHDVKSDASLLWELVIYVRRVGLRLTIEKSNNLINKALAIGFFMSQFDDPRDILVSLILFNLGAKKIGVDIGEWLSKIDPISISTDDGLFYRATHQTEKSIDITVNMFGPLVWHKK